MLKFSSIVEFIMRIVNFFLSKAEKTKEEIEAEVRKKADQVKLAEDFLLANAIKTGDWETVQRIREKREHYSNL